MRRRPAARAVRFLCDAMLGRLARDLRILGYDVAYASSSEHDDAVLLRALAEQRLLLTRDHELAARAGAGGLLLTGEHGAELDEALRALGLAPSGDDFLSRCTECGDRLVEATLPDPGVPADVARAWRCPSCGHRYWEGSHVADMRARLGRHFR